MVKAYFTNALYCLSVDKAEYLSRIFKSRFTLSLIELDIIICNLNNCK